jgi:pimeloyl-ACP methyl ester carboxylesterase
MSAGYAGYASLFNRKSADAGGLKVLYLEGGHGEPLLYIHGLEGWGAWDSYHIAFGVTNHVYAPLLPGFQDGRIPESLKSPADYATLMRKFMATVGIERAVVLGHGIGGWVGMRLAAAAPDIVSRLVLVDSLGLRLDNESESHLSDMDEEAFSHAVFARRGPVLVPFAFNPDFGGELQDIRASQDFKRYWRCRNILLKWLGDRLNDPELPELVRQIRARTLIIWGREDGLAPAQHGYRLAELIPDSRLALIEGAGHSPMKDTRETFQRIVHLFLTEAPELGDDKVLQY